MAILVFSPLARQDLRDIGDYIAKDSKANARRFVEQLMAQCERIGSTPLIYPSREDLALGLRMAAISGYLIFFRVLPEHVRIERVLHGSRNFPPLFLEQTK